MKPKSKEKQQAQSLRRKGFFVTEIAQKLKVSKSSVSLWVRNIKINNKDKYNKRLKKGVLFRQQFATECLKSKYKKIREQSQDEGRKKAQEKDWKHAFMCGLFWGEGSKNRNTVQISNCDVNIIKCFIDFLKHYFNLKQENFKIHIHCHLNNGLSVEDIVEYWSKKLSLNKNCFGKTTIVAENNKKRFKTNNHPYGICHAYVLKTSIAQHLFGAIKEYSGDNSDKWLN